MPSPGSFQTPISLPTSVYHSPFSPVSPDMSFLLSGIVSPVTSLLCFAIVPSVLFPSVLSHHHHFLSAPPFPFHHSTVSCLSSHQISVCGTHTSVSGPVFFSAVYLFLQFVTLLTLMCCSPGHKHQLILSMLFSLQETKCWNNKL